MIALPKRYQGNRDYFILEGRTVKAVPVAAGVPYQKRCINCCLSRHANPNPRLFSLDCIELYCRDLRPNCFNRGPGRPKVYFVVTEESLL